MFAHKWLGSEAMHLDAAHVTRCGDMLLGCYGGNTRVGANKNEDGALLLCAEDASWHFAALCDAHVSGESAALVLNMLESETDAIVTALSFPVHRALPLLYDQIVTRFASAEFRAACQQVRGETACLLCAQKEQWLWWLSIGDCLLYLFHTELAQLGQYALNQRNFYEWVGKVNTFDLAIPAFTSGVRELRQGPNQIVMVTDGLLECGSRPFEDASVLYEQVGGNGGAMAEERIWQVLARVHEAQGRDSATVIQWSYENPHPGLNPSG